MITIAHIDWQPMGTMPESRMDGREVFFAFRYANGTINPGPPHWLYAVGRWWNNRWLFESDQSYSVDHGLPNFWADITPPE